ncbi:MAG: type II toxin-antitoxin system ParD family antitoxin [Planctomycetes bacterium]|nr:type II toxin-antitoxin system ParD family antitoxin [Planctomycetota bacterium]
MNVSLTPQLERFVEDQVASGRYQSASEVVRDGLRLLEEREAQQRAALDEVRRKVREGLDSTRRGELFSGDAVLRELLEESRKRRKTASR